MHMFVLALLPQSYTHTHEQEVFFLLFFLSFIRAQMTIVIYFRFNLMTVWQLMVDGWTRVHFIRSHRIRSVSACVVELGITFMFWEWFFNSIHCTGTAAAQYRCTLTHSGSSGFLLTLVRGAGLCSHVWDLWIDEECKLWRSKKSGGGCFWSNSCQFKLLSIFVATNRRNGFYPWSLCNRPVRFHIENIGQSRSHEFFSILPYYSVME